MTTQEYISLWYSDSANQHMVTPTTDTLDHIDFTDKILHVLLKGGNAVYLLIIISTGPTGTTILPVRANSMIAVDMTESWRSLLVKILLRDNYAYNLCNILTIHNFKVKLYFSKGNPPKFSSNTLA